MSDSKPATSDDDDYSLLKEVLDALVGSKSPTGDLERSAAHLTERGYLYVDTAGNLRLSESGKLLLRKRSAG